MASAKEFVQSPSMEVLETFKKDMLMQIAQELQLEVKSCIVVLYCVFMLSAISPYTTGLKAIFNQSTAQVQPQLASN